MRDTHSGYGCDTLADTLLPVRADEGSSLCTLRYPKVRGCAWRPESCLAADSVLSAPCSLLTGGMACLRIRWHDDHQIGCHACIAQQGRQAQRVMDVPSCPPCCAMWTWHPSLLALPVNENLSIRIWHENLAAMCISERLPLSALTPDEHIHGGLRIQLGERFVPYLGYFGPDDVCFNTWLEEFWSAAHVFESATDARYVFDEGEQGQPAFVFERAGDRAYFSITDSGFSGGKSDPDWQRIEFSPVEFLAEHSRFRESFFAAVRAAAPDVAEEWIRQHDPNTRSA